ncbi:NAD(P)H-dependent oxidoreductase [Neolewinella aurantiaca]|uniref:NAD(P)H-dependent oxidoreductase n=1 Tax=Neolewinella aurantiaca TaxID=2602767 RepID=A0A5C7FUD4_9BACT|nr:NAD(P)H-dependent oxidoreductase [Neolewinella aurantiaca]TXF89031.1 NAD(P)H-dependent oxidoreductase [Neolewinella aurantiaca]
MSNLISALEWRYATKKFDSNHPASDADIESLKKATNLSASSFGLQPYRIVVVTDPAVKQQLRAAAFDQDQVTSASHIFVFAAKEEVSPEYVNAFMRLTADTRGVPFEALKGYADYINGSLAGKDTAAILDWTRRQSYIALGTLLAAAGELKLDACPMEGFDPAQFDEILGLPQQGLRSVVIAAVGHRSEADDTQHHAKVRFPVEEMFI